MRTLLALWLIGCAPAHPAEAGPDAPDAVDAPGATSVTLPPQNGALDYQLGQAYPPPTGVTIVSRDRNAAIAAGRYNICYVNGFQIQPDEEAFWMAQHPDLILRDAGGNPVIDVDWNEMLVDISTPAKRAAVMEIEAAWITGCKTAGFDAVEIDNLDSFARSTGLLTADDAVAMMRLLADAAHAKGLAIAQKNSSELVARKAELGTDFVVAEECNRYAECDVYRAGYGDHVLVIEYRQVDFAAGCAAYPTLSIVLRDLNLVGPTDAAYVFDGC
ncbi:MAG: endo alpha-1,4 polygalactosaminidase [Proteobacteria bacterium]|nr:endo alpha-1,4 polygalactosaminidase [Pseudomonadota bacterium]